MKRIAIVGAGWAGMAAAVEAMSLGAEVTVFEATRTLGGRARRLDVALPDGQALTLDMRGFPTDAHPLPSIQHCQSHSTHTLHRTAN